jgi:hypothetical protein
VDIWDPAKLALFALFVVPGFIAIKTYQLLFPGVQRPASEQIIDAVAYSVINYTVWWLPTGTVQKELATPSGGFCHFVYAALVMFVSPVLLVFAWRFIRTREFVKRNAPHPVAKPWDFVFSQREACWMRVVLKNGSMLGGWFGEKSFASSAPAEEQLFLEQAWVISAEGTFERPVERTAGLLVSASEISHIELIQR